MKNSHSSEDRRVKKTPYPTELEVILFISEVLGVREKGKQLYRASRKPLCNPSYEISSLVYENIQEPLRSLVGSWSVEEKDASSFDFDFMWMKICEGLFRYRDLVLDVNVGNLGREDVIPVLIEEFFVPWAMDFMISHKSDHLYSLLMYVVDEGFQEEGNPVVAVKKLISDVYESRKCASGRPFSDKLPSSLVGCLYPDVIGRGKEGRDCFNRMTTPLNLTIINLVESLARIRCPDSGDKLFSGAEVNDIKWHLFLGAFFNRFISAGKVYVSRARLLAVMKEVYGRASCNQLSVDMDFYVKRFKERISSMLNSGERGHELGPCYLLRIHNARSFLSSGNYGSAADECVVAAKSAAYSGGRLELAVVSEAFCMLAFLYRFGRWLGGEGCCDGRKLLSHMKYLKGVLLGFRDISSCRFEGYSIWKSSLLNGVVFLRDEDFSGFDDRAYNFDREVNEGALRFALFRTDFYGDKFGLKDIGQIDHRRYMALAGSRRVWRRWGNLRVALAALPVAADGADRYFDYSFY